MADQILIGNFSKGLKLDRLPFNIDNDSFPTLYNAYSWRGRVKRKRGTSFLGILQRQIAGAPSGGTPVFPALGITNGSGNLTGNLFSILGITGQNPSVTPGTVVIAIFFGTAFVEPAIPDGTLNATTLGAFGSINYATGDFSITSAAFPATAVFLIGFSYYPGLPVLGLEDFVSNNSNTQFPLLIAFDTTYAYQINQNIKTNIFFYSVSYYKNSNNPVIWSNQNFNQFWSTNYQSAFWVTNNKPGFHFVNGTYIAGTGTTDITFNFKSLAVNFTTLVIGDVLFFNEWPNTTTINGVNGTVLTILGGGNYVVRFTTVQTVSGTGIAQLLTNSIVGQDGIRWYDGDPTAGTGLPTGTGLGWVNFAPPLTALTVSINDQTAAKYYLVGALAILPFKDRLLFFAPQIQAVGEAVIQLPLQDTILWSWNGTPYYNSLVPTNLTNSETYDPTAYYVDQTGKGGYLPAGISQPLVSVMNNEDVLLVGFGGGGKKTRFVYTGNDLQPFLFYLIDSEFPSSSTFSSVVLDKGGIDIGTYGITVTTQQRCERIDLDIPDEVFKIQAINNGQKRVNAIRDFFREWIYFSYPTGDGAVANGSWIFPSQTLLFNYRDNTWAILRENYTHHGVFRESNQYSWQNLPFKTWESWNEPWNEGSSQALYPSIIAGNPQGYVLMLDQGTGEEESGTISAIADDGFGFTQITSINHCVNAQSSDQGTLGDYLSFGGTTIGLVTRTIDANNFVIDILYSTTATITAATKSTQAVLTLTFPITPLGNAINSFFIGQTLSISGVVGMTQLNGNTYTVLGTTPTTVTLSVDSTAFTTYVSGGTVTLVSYIGLGQYTRLSQPLIQTKQFPFYWQEGRQMRLGSQKYLMDNTAQGQVSVNINLSQDPDTTWNFGNIVPGTNVLNNTLVYSQLMYTCPESTNIGLTPANTNLQMPIAPGQYQIWHRLNTSLIGDSVQIGITLNDVQMRNLAYATSEIALHAIMLNVDRAGQLA